MWWPVRSIGDEKEGSACMMDTLAMKGDFPDRFPNARELLEKGGCSQAAGSGGSCRLFLWWDSPELTVD